jgi:hypothetical protein
MKKIIVLLVLVSGIIIFSCSQPASTNDPSASASAGAGEGDDNTPFPDFGYMLPPSQYDGPVFKLVADYPDTLPTDIPSFFSINYKHDWREYLERVQEYCFKGNTEVDFRVEKNKVRKWYHMPWQHYGDNGREGFHGLTQEAPVKAYQLAATQSDSTTGAVAVGWYNDIAGYTIGQVWKNHNDPVHNANVSFKHGAVLFKFLFVTFSDSTRAAQQVPSLANGLWWDGYVVSDYTKMNTPNPAIYRHATKVVLIQMDIMIRDTTSPHGWIFGNYQYNGTQAKSPKWDNLVPVGIMWDEDPQITTNQSNPHPTRTIINKSLTGTIINPNTIELPPTHLGWNGRLNGPVDNPMSSCYSCHATAEYPQLAIMSPLFNSDTAKANPPGSPGWMRWFQNSPCGQPWDNDAYSMDFSYQLSISLQNFYQWKYTQGGLFDSSYANKESVNAVAFIRSQKQAEETYRNTPKAMVAPKNTTRRVVPIQFVNQ